MIMEIRAINTLKLIDIQEIKSRRKFNKMCKKLTKLVLKYDKKSQKKGEQQRKISLLENAYAQYYPDKKKKKVSNIMLVVIVVADQRVLEPHQQ